MFPYRILRQTHLAKQFILLSLLCYGVTHAAEQQNPAQLIDEDKPQTLITLPEAYLYMGSEIGINHYQHGCESWSIDCDKNSTMASFFAGYQFNHHLAFEVAYIDLGKAEATYLEASKQNIYQGSMRGLNLSSVASIDFGADLALFAKAGVFNWHGENKGPFSTIKADDWSPSFGVGMTYQLSDSWQARLQYEYFHNLGDDNIGGTNAHVTSIGISYQFGRSRPEVITSTVINTVKNTVIKATPIELEEVTFPVLFDFDSSKLFFVDSLKIIVKRLTLYSQATVILRGYSDSQGSSEYNLALSKRRTESISQYLIEHGVKPQQIIAEYYGEQDPATDNITEQHKHLNRRVQVLLPQMTFQPQQEQQ
ncbi:OmpA family protein [Shewanella sp. PP-He15 brown]